MAKIDWAKALDLEQAVTNLKVEAVGDWHQDPWGWPELHFLLKKQPDFVYQHAGASGSLEPALIDVPKENWGTRPAVVLDITERLTYQALVDQASLKLIGQLSPNVFGWRLPPVAPTAGIYSHNNNQWDGYRRHMLLLAGLHGVALRTDLVSCFASVPIDSLQESIHDHCGSNSVTKSLCDLVQNFSSVPNRSGLPQRSLASSVLANMYLMPLDDVLRHHSRPLPVRIGSKVSYHCCARWMDDMWLFGNDPAVARRAQVSLQDAAQSIGLHLNYAKTDVLEGDEVLEAVLEMEHS